MSKLSSVIKDIRKNLETEGKISQKLTKEYTIVYDAILKEMQKVKGSIKQHSGVFKLGATNTQFSTLREMIINMVEDLNELKGLKVRPLNEHLDILIRELSAYVRSLALFDNYQTALDYFKNIVNAFVSILEDLKSKIGEIKDLEEGVKRLAA